MATEVGTAYVTIAPKMSNDFDSTIAKAADTSGSKIGGSFGKTFSVAAGNIIADAFSAIASTIASHLDAAISRVDTLNQFPRVMQNVGFSADEATAALAKMSEGIQGLPTTLDDIVGNTQALAISMGDLDKATDVAIALNDAMLTYGASSYQVSNAVIQLNQMITQGTYDMQSWKSINQSAPGLLDTVARSMLGAGSSAEGLRSALNDGTVSTKEFLNQLVLLDTEGTDGVTAFSEAVFSATGGIETSMSRVDSAITRNLANIINLGAETIGFSGICDNAVSVINAVGTSLADGLNRAVEYLTPYLQDAKVALDDLIVQLSPWFFDAVSLASEILFEFVVYVLSDAIEKFKEIVQVITTVIDFFRRCAESGKESFSMLRDAITSAISDLPAKALQWGKDIIGNLIQGIRSKISELVSAASNIAGTISSYIHFSEPDVGPLSDFHTYMPDMIEGMAQGIKDNMWKLDDAMSGFTGGIKSSITMAPASTQGNITIHNLTVNAEDATSAEQFVSMLRRASVAYA